MTAAEVPLGVYGLRINGLPDLATRSLVTVGRDATAIDVEVTLASSTTTMDHCDGSRLVLAYERGSRYEIRREPPSAVLALPALPSPEALVHPLLTIVASTHSRWLGALTLHGGAVVLGSQAWVLIAAKDGGKSTTLAGLAALGYPVLTDDLVVVDGEDVLAGPRSIDLRTDAAEHLRQGEYIGVTAGRRRHRIALDQAPLRARLAGIVALSWSHGGATKLEQLSVPERLRRLCAHEALPMMGVQPPGVLFPAVEVPMYELSRPRSWDAHRRVLDALVDLAGRPPAPRRATPAGGGSTSATAARAGPTRP